MFSEHLFQEHLPKGSFSLNTINSWQLLTNTLFKVIKRNIRRSVISAYCRFSCAGTWELVNLFVGTKNFSYHICYENIDRKHREQTELNNMLVRKSVLNEINKGTFTQGFKDCRKIKRKVSQNLDDLQNLLIRLTVKASSEKA